MDTQTIRILVIEDNPGDVRLLVEYLKEDTSSHYELHSEGQLNAGLDYLAKARVDIILLDLSLPDSQGFETFTKINTYAPHIPIVILTGLSDNALALQAVKAGAQDYLVKGKVSGDLLARTIRYSVQRKQAETEMHRLINELRNLSEVEKKNRLFAEALAKNVISIRSTLNADEILDSIITNINSIVPSDAINIMLIEGDHARIVRSKGYQERGLTDWVEQKQFNLNEIKALKEIIRSKTYVVTSNTVQSKTWNPITETNWIKSNIICPILQDETVLGFVNVDSTTPDFYSEEHAHNLILFTDQVSTALKNARLFEATQLRLNRMQAMTQIDQAINSSLDLNVSLEIVISNAKEQLNADAVDILRLEDSTSSLIFTKAKGFKTDEIHKTNLSLGNGFPGRAALERAIVVVPDLNSTDANVIRKILVEREGFISYYCSPLITKGKLKGVMEVYFRQPFHADQEWLEFLEMLCQQTAIAINNAELVNSLQKSNFELLNAYETTLKGWVDALDMRDHETQGHTLRVTEFSLNLAKRIGIKDSEIINFQRGALLHDIGKVAVPDAILNKPGPLTDEEWVIMRGHPLIAFQLLSKSKYLIPALDIPYCHHEKWDGSGYPRGLKGEAIPLAARIFSIIDVWDALTSDRPYRKAWTKKKALNYIQEQSEIYFDPKVVTGFVALILKEN
jgi:response regulator RpfG family c-di-GMP phosphodiesterase